MTYFDSSMLKANTENGRDWLAKYLHPPSSKGVSYNGYPDRSSTSTIHTEYRLNYEKLPIATNQGENSNACLFLSSPGLTTPIYYARGINGADPKWLPALVNNQVSANSIADNMGRVRTSYQSETFQYDATAFNNSGMCYSAQFNPSTYILSVPSFISRLVQQKSPHLQSFIKSLGLTHGNEHLTRAKQAATNASNDEYDMIEDPRAIPTSFNCIQVVKLNSPVTSPGDITMLSPKSYTARSVEGAFVVHQCNEDTNPFKSVRSAYVSAGTVSTSKPLMYCVYEYKDDASGTTYLEPFFMTSAEGLGNYVIDIEWSDWSWSYTMFTGCTPDTSLNINIKYIAGFEVAPLIKSVLNSQAMPPALYDPTALETAAILTQSRQDAMPAAMNSGGLVAALGASLATVAVDKVAKAISGADAKPAEAKKMEGDMNKAVQGAQPTQTLDVVTDSARPSLPSSNTSLSARFGSYRRPAQKRRSTNKPARGMQNMQSEIAKLRRQISSMHIRGPARKTNRSKSRARSSSRGRSNSRVRFQRQPRR